MQEIWVPRLTFKSAWKKMVGRCNCFSFLIIFPNPLRFTMPAKSFLTKANLGGDDEYAEMGTRFKASHIKLLIWWLAKETQEFADQNPSATR